jgi:hypothetical protein
LKEDRGFPGGGALLFSKVNESRQSGHAVMVFDRMAKNGETDDVVMVEGALHSLLAIVARARTSSPLYTASSFASTACRTWIMTLILSKAETFREQGAVLFGGWHITSMQVLITGSTASALESFCSVEKLQRSRRCTCAWSIRLKLHADHPNPNDIVGSMNERLTFFE